MSNEPTRLVIRTPDDAIAAVPYLLGFHPSDSLVVLGFDGPANTCAIRVDLPSDPSTVRLAADHIASVIGRNGFRSALIIGYGPSTRVTAAAAAAWESLAAAGVRITEAMRVADRRWWSLTCLDKCCPPEGRSFDTTTTEIAANATYTGHAALPDRDELRRSIAPPPGKAESAVRKATLQAEAEITQWSKESPADLLTARKTTKALDLLENLRATTIPPTNSDSAMLSVLMADQRVRDEIWIRLNSRDITLWREILRRTPTPHAAAPASLLAFLAYSAGDGSLANVALERAEEANPHYSLAALIRAIIALGVPPQKARLKLTPNDLNSLYNTGSAAQPPPRPKTPTPANNQPKPPPPPQGPLKQDGPAAHQRLKP